MNMWCLNNYHHIWKEIVYFTVTNMDLDRVIQLASVKFVNDLIQQIDSLKIPTSILIDLSKALDIPWLTEFYFLNYNIMAYQGLSYKLFS